jgi:hypothetical protein
MEILCVRRGIPALQRPAVLPADDADVDVRGFDLAEVGVLGISVASAEGFEHDRNRADVADRRSGGFSLRLQFRHDTGDETAPSVSPLAHGLL